MNCWPNHGPMVKSYHLCFTLIPYRVFPRLFTHGGGGGTNAGGQSVNGGTHEGENRPYGGGGPNFDRLYHKLKVLLLLSCNYTMQFVGYDSIKAR